MTLPTSEPSSQPSLFVLFGHINTHGTMLSMEFSEDRHRELFVVVDIMPRLYEKKN